MNRLTRNNNNQYNLTIAKKEQKTSNQELNFLHEISKYRRIDAPYLIVTLILVSFGLIMLFSASMSTSFATQGDNSKHYFIRQIGFSAIGLSIGLVIANFVDIQFFRKRIFYKIAYVVTSLLLLLVFAMGKEQLGATRWLSIAGIGFQPSELAKFMAVFVLAGYFSEMQSLELKAKYRNKSKSQQFWYEGRVKFLYPVILVGIWFFLILIQPHLSGAIIFAMICLAVFLAARIPWRSWLSGLIQLLPVLLVLILISTLLFPLIRDGQSLPDFVISKFAHSAERIETFEDDSAVSADQSYQTRQAEITMGSGGLTGVGLGQGRQKYNYLPQIHNDYIFPAIAEELGYIGTMTVMILFAIQFILGVKITLKTSSLFACLISWGYVFLIIIQVILNVGVATKVIPATGITLPFFSYGGTSNIIFLVEVGMILCISKSG
ncbi:MAG TPA: FtsW/RodA/SpoVE family cell cycle protein, partial [Candidatus Eisenbacteria bacterium]|nr:FtsW/RodA/SpoVE family cell cycle protein [Candidatus Eisenbacteria bacterium]